MARGGTYILIGPGGARIPVTNLSAYCKEQGWDVLAVRPLVDTGSRHEGWQVWREANAPAAEADEVPVVAGSERSEVPVCPVRLDPEREPDRIKSDLRQYMAWVMRCHALFTTRPELKPEDFKVKEHMAAAEQFAKFCGVNWADVADERTVAERIEQVGVSVLENGEEAFSVADEICSRLEYEFDQISERGEKYWAELNERARRAGNSPPKSWAERARKWCNLFRRIQVLRKRARDAYDASWPGVNERVQRATHLLRFMVYVGRSDMPAKTRGDKVMRIGLPQVAYAVGLFCAMEGYGGVPGVGMLAPGDPDPTRGGVPFEGYVYDGELVFVPPGHAKSTMIKHDIVLSLNLRPEENNVYVTAENDNASAMCKAVTEYFDPRSAYGRRNMSLYPAERETRYQNNGNEMRLRVPNPPAYPQLICEGIGANRQGVNAIRMWGDDLVPKDDRYNEGDRRKRIGTWEMTWSTRLRAGSFLVVAGYPHHQDDLNWTFRKRSDLGVATNGREGTLMWQVILPVGGPDDEVPFKPVWPEMWDTDRLRRKFNGFSDASVWPSNYQLKPQSNTERIVREVDLYLPDTDEHREFMAGAEIIVSLDPAANGDGSGDTAGLVVAALGDARWFEKRMGGEVECSETQLRVIYETEFHATQPELTQHLIDMGETFDIGRVFVEVAGAYGSAILHMLAEWHGVTVAEEAKSGTGNKSKAARLRAVSALLDNSVAGHRPPVKFPGRTVPGEDGEMNRYLPAESMERLIGYVVDYASTSGHHSLDALTQMLRKLMPELRVGAGAFSDKVREAQRRVNPAIQRMIEKQQRERRQRSGPDGMLRVLQTQGV